MGNKVLHKFRIERVNSERSFCAQKSKGIMSDILLCLAPFLVVLYKGQVLCWGLGDHKHTYVSAYASATRDDCSGGLWRLSQFPSGLTTFDNLTCHRCLGHPEGA